MQIHSAHSEPLVKLIETKYIYEYKFRSIISPPPSLHTPFCKLYSDLEVGIRLLDSSYKFKTYQKNAKNNNSLIYNLPISSY